MDASKNPLIAAKLLNPDTRDAYIRELEQEQEALRASLGQKKETLASLSEARKHPIEIVWRRSTDSVRHPAHESPDNHYAERSSPPYAIWRS